MSRTPQPIEVTNILYVLHSYSYLWRMCTFLYLCVFNWIQTPVTSWSYDIVLSGVPS